MNLANKITLARIGLIPLFVFFLQPYSEWMTEKFSLLQHIENYGVYWAVATFIIAAATDKFDGYIARRYNQITNLGKLLDPMADKLLIAIALIMMVQDKQITTWIAVVIIGREMLVSGIRILAAAKGVALAADRYGKIKLLFQVIAIVAVLLSSQFKGIAGVFPIAYLLMMIAVVLTIYSGVNYLRKNYRRLDLNIM